MSNTKDSELCISSGIQHNNSIIFCDADGNNLGRLYFENKKIHFEGNADESAIVFFEHVLKNYNKEN